MYAPIRGDYDPNLMALSISFAKVSMYAPIRGDYDLPSCNRGYLSCILVSMYAPIRGDYDPHLKFAGDIVGVSFNVCPD